ncbi:unnamed protein product [Rotaria socialis]|uniref:Uncharacterized protein n=1 Tax=Rotaria socialis TaxID=392032 RepID=A0A817MXW9_9BILA|nr:unnamed protein product [Rotaria socialis]
MARQSASIPSTVVSGVTSPTATQSASISSTVVSGVTSPTATPSASVSSTVVSSMPRSTAQGTSETNMAFIATTPTIGQSVSVATNTGTSLTTANGVSTTVTTNPNTQASGFAGTSVAMGSIGSSSSIEVVSLATSSIISIPTLSGTSVGSTAGSGVGSSGSSISQVTGATMATITQGGSSSSNTGSASTSLGSISSLAVGSTVSIPTISQSSAQTGVSQESSATSVHSSVTASVASMGSSTAGTTNTASNPSSVMSGETSAFTGTSMSVGSGSTASLSSGASSYTSSMMSASVSTIASSTQSGTISANTGSAATISSQTQSSSSIFTGTDTSSAVTQSTVTSISPSLSTGITAQTQATGQSSVTSGVSVSGSISVATSSATTITANTGSSISSVSMSGTTVSNVAASTSQGVAQTITGSITSNTNAGTSTTVTVTVGSTLTSTNIASTGMSTVMNSQTSVIANTITSVAITVTTTVAPVNLIYTDFKVYGNSFNPNNSTEVEALRQGLIAVINLGYQCISNSSNPQCFASSRRKRAAPSFVNVTILQNVTLISAANVEPKIYRVTYVVNDGTTQLPASAVKSAVDTVPINQQLILFKFIIVGSFVQSPSISTTPSVTSTDNQLWIIGAVLGPIAFVLLLICLCCCLHAKFRRRQHAGSTATTMFHVPHAPPRSTNYHAPKNEPMKEQGAPLNTTGSSGQRNVSRSNTLSPRRLPPIELHNTSNNMPQYPASVDIPLQSVRHQNDVERWRNKLRLQEKFEQRYADPLNDLDQLQNSSPFVPHGSIRSVNELNLFETSPSTHGTRRTLRTPELEVGRTRLHRLLDEVLDQAEPNQSNNADSQSETRQRHIQQPSIHSPMIPRVSERPDPTLLRHHYNPYEAGDRIHDIEHALPAFSMNDNDTRNYNPQSSYRTSPPLFYDDDNQQRDVRARIETDRTGHRHHKFDDDVVYIDTIPKNRDGTRIQMPNRWMERDGNNGQLFHLNPSDLTKRNDYQDEYELAKRSVVNTKHLVSSIHDDLQQIISDPLNDSHYV